MEHVLKHVSSVNHAKRDYYKLWKKRKSNRGRDDDRGRISKKNLEGIARTEKNRNKICLEEGGKRAEKKMDAILLNKDMSR